MVPALAAVLGLVAHLFLAPIFMERWQIYGLVGSTSVSTFVNASFLFIVFYAMYGHFGGRVLLASALKYGVACLAVAGVCWGAEWALKPNTFWGLVTFVFIAVAGSGVAYFSACSLLKVEEAQEVLDKIKRRIGRKKSQRH